MLGRMKLTLVLLAAVGCTGSGCTGSRAPDAGELRGELSELDKWDGLPRPSSVSDSSMTPKTSTAFHAPREVEEFCSNCHAIPQPTSFPREAWYDEIYKGFEFYARSGRSDLKPPPLSTVVKTYREQAPTTLKFPSPSPIDEAWRKRFEREEVRWGDSVKYSPAVSSIRWVKQDAAPFLLTTDMRDGCVNKVIPQRQKSQRQLLARVKHPARAVPCDLNDDGQTDFVVADLGSFSPYDHSLGQVTWLKRDQEKYEPVTLAQGLGRIADVSVADYSGDDKPDLLVAEFGHRRTGGIHLMTNLGGAELQFISRMLDVRPGTVQVLAHDWNSDGSLDFAALVSQEFECVDLFIKNDRKYDRHRAAAGRDLTFGSVGMELADIDGDGDQDIIYVNGDSFDNNFSNLSHGVQWLENLNDLDFKLHRVLELPGAYRAVPADIDGDSDCDIIVVANLPSIVYPESLMDSPPASLVVLEQLPDHGFRSHVLERGTARYPALEVADFDGNGKVDLAVGALLFDTDAPDSPPAKLPPLAIWWQL